jgi:hypothetical protein
VGTETEVLDGLTSVLGTTDKNSVRAGWRSQSKLIKCDDFTPGLFNTRTSGSGYGKRCERKLGHLKQTDIISNLSYDNNRLALMIGFVMLPNISATA